MDWRLAILAAFLLLFGCVGSLKPTDKELKACAVDSDCSLEYGVWYNSTCVKGCFNSEKSAVSLVRDPCRGTIYSLFPQNASCACIEEACTLKNG